MPQQSSDFRVVQLGDCCCKSLSLRHFIFTVHLLGRGVAFAPTFIHNRSVPTTRGVLVRRFLTFSFAAALLAPATAQALGSRTYDFCGGQYTGYTGFAFCVSVTVGTAPSIYTTGSYTVTLDVMKVSGHNGSYSGTLFAQIGLDNLIPDAKLARTPNMRIAQYNSQTKMYDIVCSDLKNNTAKVACWDAPGDKNMKLGDPMTPVQITFDTQKDFDRRLYGKGGTQDNSSECATPSWVAKPVACDTEPPAEPTQEP